MSSQNLARVLIVDNDERVRVDFTEIFTPLGYRVQVAQGEGEALLDHALALATSFRPNVALVDLRLLDETRAEYSGFTLVEKMPWAQCIIISSYLDSYATQNALLKYHVNYCYNKTDDCQLLIDAIGAAAVTKSAVQRRFRIHSRLDWTMDQIAKTLSGTQSNLSAEIVQDLLSQLFPTSSEIVLASIGDEPLPPIISKQPSSGSASRGHAVVLKVYPDDLEPAIVKLAPLERISKEVQNYRQYVEHRLTGHYHAHLDNAVEFWDIGGAVYSFMGSAMRDLPSFAFEYRKQNDPQLIVRPLRHFFVEVCQRYYSNAVPNESESLFDLYDRSLHLVEHLRKFPEKSYTRRFPGIPMQLLHPIPWVLQYRNHSLIPAARLATTHGDLHGDNLFVEEGHAWAIDFERTGTGHILRDFVELEVDILTRLIDWSADDLSHLRDFYRVLMEHPRSPRRLRCPEPMRTNPELNKAFEVIAGLRELACQVTRYQEEQEYLWALLLDAVFVGTLAPEQSLQRERALLLAAVICERLENWIHP